MDKTGLSEGYIRGLWGYPGSYWEFWGGNGALLVLSFKTFTIVVIEAGKIASDNNGDLLLQALDVHE